jgi:cob(I)alamin adenosyltransferase
MGVNGFATPAKSLGRMGRMAIKSSRLRSLTEEDINERHADKMRKKKAVRDKILATKTDEKGLVIVNTGKGKG